ncbi:FtsB family cell division protein [Brevibacillus ginsengisoli]|uniref:FtsB family cell division protein n=1 Tax=Brevibacillus ginsengisoli TaxID=363854 RepID=UPI003CF62BEA
MKNGTHQVNRNKQKRRIRLVLLVMLLISVWTGYTIYLQSSSLAQSEEDLNKLKQQSMAIKQKQTELTYKASRLNDKEYIAELARKNLYFSKPNEIIFVLPDK